MQGIRERVRNHAVFSTRKTQTEFQPTHSPQMNGKIEVFQGRDRQWYFRLKASNGRTIAQSEGYTRRRNCVDGIKSLIGFNFNVPIQYLDYSPTH